MRLSRTTLLYVGSEEVAVTISGYIAKTIKQTKGELCTLFMVDICSTIPYYNHLSKEI